MKLWITILALFTFLVPISSVHASSEPEKLIIVNTKTERLALFDHGKIVRELPLLNERKVTLDGKLLIVLKKDKSWLGVNVKGTDGKQYGFTSDKELKWEGLIYLSPEDLAWLTEQVPLETPVWVTSSRDTFYMLYDDAVEMPIPKKLPTDKPLTLIEDTVLFLRPDLNSSTTYQLSPQTIRAYEKWGSWYHVHTFQGDLWIPDYSVLVGTPIIYKKKIRLLQNTPLYRYPAPDQQTQTALSSQIVEAEERYEDWFKVKTDYGSLWIHPAQVEEQ